MTLQASVPVRVFLFDWLSSKRIVHLYIYIYIYMAVPLDSVDYVAFDSSIATHLCDRIDI
jgi:hypothetical protein